MKLLIVCTGNSCRSQMAHGFMKSFDPGLEVYSAGIKPESVVNPYAIKVMNESFIDISQHIPHNINQFVNDDFDLLLTVCDNAKTMCPEFEGNVTKRIHMGFEDPADAIGSDQEILNFYRKIRDEIKNEMFILYKKLINNKS
jgi:arsenate reductase